MSKHQKADPHIAVYRVRKDGFLDPIGRAPIDPGLTPVSMAISADGNDLYVGLGTWRAGFLNGAVAHYRINGMGVPEKSNRRFVLGIGSTEPPSRSCHLMGSTSTSPA